MADEIEPDVAAADADAAPPPSNKSSPTKLSITVSPTKLSPAASVKVSIKSANAEDIDTTVSKLEPQGQIISEQVQELNDSVNKLAQSMDDPQSPIVGTNIEKIAKMSKILTNEANALRESIRSLSQDIARTKQELGAAPPSMREDVNFPYHLFLIELIVNKIHMKCECFELDYNNLVISATFLGKPPIILYDASYGKIDNFSKLNVGKSTLFAMTYDKICTIKEFEVVLQLTKQPPCANCVTKIAETHMDYTNEFLKLREELCKKWSEEQPNDNIICTTSTPLSKSLFYLSCGDQCKPESIGVIEVSCRMSFLGKEITTAFSAGPKPRGTSQMQKDDYGMMMYSCQKVEMDDQGKILLDEDVLDKKERSLPAARTESPMSSVQRPEYNNPYGAPSGHHNNSKYDEIFTKMNENELRIRVPKSTKVERTGKYDKIQELCSCEDNPYNTGDQVQFELPKDLCYPDKTHNTYTSDLKYTYKGCDRSCEKKDKKVVNVTPTNCPVPVNMEKVLHPQKDVFILKIGKKLETKDKKTDLEIELVTPKLNSDKNENNAGTQSSATALGKALKGKKKDGKKGGKKSKSKTSVGKKKSKGKKK